MLRIVGCLLILAAVFRIGQGCASEEEVVESEERVSRIITENHKGEEVVIYDRDR